MAHELDAVFFVQKPPTMELRDGLFHIGYDVGRNARFEIVLQPSAYAKGLAAAQKIWAEFQSQNGKGLVDFKAKRHG